MPSVVIPPGIVNSAFRWRLQGDPEEMVHTIAWDPDGSSTDPTEIAQELAANWAVHFESSDINIGWVFVGVTAYLGQDGGDPLVGEGIENLAGSRTEDSCPNNCATLWRKNTSLGGRRGRGRMYIPPAFPSEGEVSNTGMISTVDMAAFQLKMNDFIVLMAASSVAPMAPVLLHSSAPFTPTPITSVILQPQIATQRTRLRR